MIDDQMKPYSRRRAYYDGIINGGLIGLSLGFLVLFILLNDAGVAIPLYDVYVFFALLIAGIIGTAYDAHRAASAP